MIWSFCLNRIVNTAGCKLRQNQLKNLYISSINILLMPICPPILFRRINLSVSYHLQRSLNYRTPSAIVWRHQHRPASPMHLSRHQGF
uniref:Uncharacterized protein n=1 Tax=Anopheles dirus TaxID=7168 RepID=A0A182NDS5_9DIPT